jgi:hypothetical protein
MLPLHPLVVSKEQNRRKPEEGRDQMIDTNVMGEACYMLARRRAASVAFVPFPHFSSISAIMESIDADGSSWGVKCGRL